MGYAIDLSREARCSGDERILVRNQERFGDIRIPVRVTLDQPNTVKRKLPSNRRTNGNETNTGADPELFRSTDRSPYRDPVHEPARLNNAENTARDPFAAPRPTNSHHVAPHERHFIDF
ncbi:hypothetical protein GCM10017567_73760 [Amycolatopsis bullii]|uniref:Uncharacterized protein n=1 Tax=Amycolatopsis bullii TaxID=941987 RepID=A0ABQ3KR72_9PSEU|nr:hypothetical protein GCM10017567_73760 [Amycolatopsis bullii]